MAELPPPNLDLRINRDPAHDSREMFMSSRRLYMALLGTSALVVCLTLLFHLSAHSSLHSSLSLKEFPLTSYAPSYGVLLANIRPSDAEPHSRTLGIASHIYVLSLPRRVDRRRSMNSLSRALDLHFEYVDGLEATDPSVDHALDILKAERKAFKKEYSQNNAGSSLPGIVLPGLSGRQGGTKGNATLDAWFNETDRLAASVSSLTIATSFSTSIRTGDRGVHDNDLPLSCATPEDPFPDPLNKTEVHKLPPWRILSRGMISCWIAHHRIIHKIATLRDENAVAIVLEDDVDMEFDIERRLRRLWPALPQNNWDIVMLGYCHSNEMEYPPLAGAASLRPSFAPKCTHAYALSRVGARRLFQMLSIPGFAYSRALDQAISWLIQTKEIRSYSIVPAVVVQRKLTRSDIWHFPTSTGGRSKTSSGRGNENGSNWRDGLVDSTLERVDMVASRDAMAVQG